MSTIGKSPEPSQSLNDWLAWLETIHPIAIDMGLDRVGNVADRLSLRPARAPLILVGGTNGKGSTVAMLSAIYTQSGYTVGAYTSPHIEHFCERIKVNGQAVNEDDVVEALSYIEGARGPDSLTYFEFTTLAAMRVFSEKQCDVLLFEVGLGGRLDATNIWDAQCSIITSVALDHEEYLGSDVSIIATEKAAIGRPGKPFIVGETDPPESLAQYASEHQFSLVDVGALSPSQLPETALPGMHQRRNAACALEAVLALQNLLPVRTAVARQALSSASFQARFERRQIEGVDVIFDVAHNLASAVALVQTWKDVFGEQTCEIVFAALADKDIDGMVSELSSIVDSWHCLALHNTDRAMAVDDLSAQISQMMDIRKVLSYSDAGEAMKAALDSARLADRAVLVAGSFYTIAAIKALHLPSAEAQTCV